MNLTKITVVTVVYNDVHNIENTMCSVMDQTYPDIEYIVIDGGSKDGTWEIISKYKERLAYAVSEPDKGVYDAMNKAIGAATGEWIIFMNCGDSFYSNETVEKAFQNYTDQGESIIYGDFRIVNHPRKGNYYVKAMAQTSDKVVYVPSFHQAIFTRTKELKQHSFDTKYKIIADTAFFYDLYRQNHNWYYTNTIICNYDYTGLSATSRIPIMHEYALFYTSRCQIRKALRYWIVYLKRRITG